MKASHRLRAPWREVKSKYNMWHFSEITVPSVVLPPNYPQTCPQAGEHQLREIQTSRIFPQVKRGAARRECPQQPVRRATAPAPCCRVLHRSSNRTESHLMSSDSTTSTSRASSSIPREVRTLISHAMTVGDEQTPDCPRCGLRRHHSSARFCRRCGEALRIEERGGG